MLRLGTILALLVNRERIRLDLSPVKYDFSLEKSLGSYNGSYLYSSGSKNVSWTIEGQTRFCDLNGCHLKPLGYNYMFRDTFKDSVPRIFRYRIAQGSICTKTVFADGDPCSWYYAFYPVIVQNFTRFGCREYNYQGRYVPKDLINKQKRSFWCFFDSRVYYLAKG